MNISNAGPGGTFYAVFLSFSLESSIIRIDLNYIESNHVVRLVQERLMN